MSAHVPNTSSLRDLDLAELHAMHSLLCAGVAAVVDQLTQPRFSAAVEAHLLEAVRPISELNEAVIAETKTRRPKGRREAEMKFEMIVGRHLRAGEIERAVADCTALGPELIGGR